MASKAVVIRRNVVTRVKRVARRSTQFTIPLGLVAGMAPTVIHTVNEARVNGIESGVKVGMRGLTGYNVDNGQWHFSSLKEGLLPLLIGMAAHKFVGGSLGVNRALASARVPFIRI